MNKRQRFNDKDYRASYAESHLDSLIATQIRVLRDQRRLQQQQLAALAGMKQSRISALEDVNYSSWSIKTLKRLARAFDVRLHVSFESFGSLLGDDAKLTAANLRRCSFEDDPAFSGIVLQADLEAADDPHEDGLACDDAGGGRVVVSITESSKYSAGRLRSAIA